MKSLITLFIAMLVSVLSVSSSVSAATIKVTPSAGPPKNAASYNGYATNALAAIRSTGTLPAGTRQSPTDARLLTVIGAEDLMTSATVSYRGIFNPPAPWNQERGGTVWWWLDVTAGAGETVSLSGINAVIASTDSINKLGKTVSFVNDSYSALAIGIKADGSTITSGSATQAAQRVIVAVLTTSFPISSVADVASVQRYIAQFLNWKITCLATAANATAVGTTQVSALKPKLFPRVSGEQFKVMAENNGDATEYPIQISLDLSQSVWFPWGTIKAGQEKDISAINAISQKHVFVRYTP